MQTETAEVTQTPINEKRLFSPSFLDRFMRSVRRLPIPYWLTYLLLFTIQVLIFHVLSWADGWIPRFTFNAMILIFPIWQWMTFAIITFLNGVAAETINTFSPLLKITDEERKRLETEFTTLPNAGVAASGVIWAVVYAAMTMLAIRPIYAALHVGSGMTTIVIIEGLISYCTGSVIYYHSIRQLLLVNRTVRLVKHFDLFHLEPVYAFSRLTSLTGIGWMLLLSLTILTFPMKFSNVIVLGILVVQVIMAIAAFILPLWVVHRRLLAERRRLLGEHRKRVETVLQKLHLALDQNREEEARGQSNILQGLNMEKDILMGISTFPWRESTLRGFLLAIVIPIILFLIQLAIHQWLGI